MLLARRFSVCFAVVLAITGGLIALSGAWVSPAFRGGADQDDLKPLVDVEHLMESVVNPAFASVKKGLGEKPENRKSWKQIHSASIVIGESGNLLLFRKPEEADAKAWTSLSVGLREAADGLVKATRAQDYDASTKAYLAVVNACNKCHGKFGEDGEPKIEP